MSDVKFVDDPSIQNIGGVSFTEENIQQILAAESEYLNVDGVCYTKEDIKTVVANAEYFEAQRDFLKEELYNILKGGDSE